MLNFLSTRFSALLRRVPPATLSSTIFLLAVGAALGFGLPLGLAHPYDRTLHGVFFALLTISLSGFFQGRALPVLILATVLAGGGEILQGMTGYRDMLVVDFIASLIGALSAAGVLSIHMPSEKLSFIERERVERGLPK
ncbi:hypothetical protein [Breoghania sp.]|uniref:hypothetical protein n=1 Tax=Breoghania sp. TaxID=2065378 RepID=UPI002616EFE2|nr:hypothetical protein [Breoghania sp.]MDJ0933160.1 hypothetical protein [Breoghania sp.]